MFVTPTVFRTGYTEMDLLQITKYLEHTGQTAFLQDINDARDEGLGGAEIMCSLYAKLCYKSVVEGKNANVKRVRSIAKNLEATFDSAHGSVFEHVGYNFICTDVSRVFTHELVRHRIGTAFSQTSGRYCRPVDEDGVPRIDFVHDPILDPVKPDVEAALEMLGEGYRRMEIRLGLLEQSVADRMRAKWAARFEDLQIAIATGHDLSADENLQMTAAAVWVTMLSDYKESTRPFDTKKKLTSALRRILPNGQSNEIAFSCNIRSLRHCVQLRTQRFAEWEIRNVFAQIFELVRGKHPMVFYGAKTRMVDGLPEVYGMRLQPYDLSLPHLPAVDLLEELRKRRFTSPDPDALLRFVEAINSPLDELTAVA